MAELSIQERMAQLREGANTSPRSDDKTPTPLWVFLYLRARLDQEPHLYDWQHIKLIYNWLQPIEIPILDTSVGPYIALFMDGYKASDLANLLHPEVNCKADLKERQRLVGVVIHTIIYEVLPKLQERYK